MAGCTIEELGRNAPCVSAGHETERRIRAIKEKHRADCGLVRTRPWAPLYANGERPHRGSDIEPAEAGRVALPIHDAVAVPRSCAETAKAVMQAEAKRLTGADVLVDIQIAAK